MSALIDSVLSIILIAGSILLVVAGMRVMRADSYVDRIQAVVKAGSGGLALLLLGVALAAGDFAIFVRASATGVILLLGAAFSGQVLGWLAEDRPFTDDRL
jgi:multisubunit Na+/H+ antiporter MnhG subunit